MTQFEGLPEDVRSKLKTDPRAVSGNELLPAAVAETMFLDDRPIWTAAQMRAELETGHRQETVRKKLESLDEIDICDSMEANNGRIYWWNDERSDWPIPPDIPVDRRRGPTVAEVLDPWYVKWAILGLLGPTFAGIPMLVGIFQIDGRIWTPISGEGLLSAGFIIVLLSYMIIAYAAILGFIQYATDDSIDLDLF